MFKFISRFLEQRSLKRSLKKEKELLLYKDGCILYCRGCRAILNGLGNDGKDFVYVADCICGMRSRFLLDTPVPILLTCEKI
jgi:hypothetical protein